MRPIIDLRINADVIGDFPDLRAVDLRTPAEEDCVLSLTDKPALAVRKLRKGWLES